MEQLLIITPCRNELEFGRNTLDSVCNQTIRPDLWIIVDDGSTDGTTNLLYEYEERFTFIKVIKKENRGNRSVGPGVVETFYYGLGHVDINKFKYVCKLDLDLAIPKYYFEKCIAEFEADKKLGTFSGKPYVKVGNDLVMEPTGDEMSVGMIKLYRVSCFQAIGGFVREVMWDGIDCHMCRFKGWKAQSSDSFDLRFTHLRPMGSSQVSIYVGKKRHGFGQYYMGTSFLYFLASCIYRVKHKPYFLGAFFMLLGYLNAAVSKENRFQSVGFSSYLKKYQMKCLLIGKNKTLKIFNAEIDRGEAFTKE
jgi:biofilm PGA synthesis N-glycosyltransferase PgaC